MAETLEIVPLTELDGSAIDMYQHAVSGLVQEDTVRDRIEVLGLHGVLARHTPVEGGPWPPERGLRASREKMADDELEAFLLVERSMGRLVGMATVQPGLELKRQRLPMPARVARRVPLMSMPVIRSEGSANFAAWLDPDTDEHDQSLQQVYGHLGESAQRRGLAWTLLPDKRSTELTAYDVALSLSGFEAKDADRYDDVETGGWVSRSWLYLPRQ